jgi:putative membrane protein
MKTKLLPALLICLMYVAQSCNDPKTAKKYNYETSVDAPGLGFLNDAIEGGRTEIKASMLAQNISKNQQVVDFAKMMIHDHTEAVEELKKIRTDVLADGVSEIGPEAQEKVDSLSKLTGDQFDKAYMQMMVADHDEAVDLLSEGMTTNKPAIETFAWKTLPVVQKHLGAAKNILASLK